MLVLAAAVYGLAIEGLGHVEPAKTLRQAQQDWQEGRLGAALGGHVHAYAMAVEAAVRWKAARVYVNRMAAAREAGQMDKALGACSRVVAILHGYDDEGSLSHECYIVEAEIQRQSQLK